MIALTSLSKNHINVGPEIIMTPTAITNAIENLGIETSAIFSLLSLVNEPNDGSSVNAKKMIPPIQIAATRL